MSEQHHDGELLGAYVLGVLDEREKQEIDEHTATCEECRTELSELREMETMLGELPPEAFLEGPPEDADLLLQRTLRQARGERNTAKRTWSLAVGAAVAASAALVFLGGYLAGDDTGTEATGPVIPTATSAGPSVTAVPGVRVASAVDPATGSRMTLRLTPAAGWIRLNASVTGIPAGERCHLVVVSKDGGHEDAGSWLVGDNGSGGGKPANLDGSAAVDAGQVTSVMVQNDAGKTYVTVPV